MTASITAERKPRSSRVRTPWMVVPPGSTPVLQLAGVGVVLQHQLCRALHHLSRIGQGLVLGRPQATPPSARASMNTAQNAGPQPDTALAALSRSGLTRSIIPAADSRF